MENIKSIMEHFEDSVVDAQEESVEIAEKEPEPVAIPEPARIKPTGPAVIQPPTEAKKQGLVAKFAERFSVEPTKLLGTLKATVFRQKNGEVTDQQMMALLVVADQYALNPFTKEIYAFPSDRGIVPVVSVDGWNRIMQSHPNFDGIEFSYPDMSEWVIISEGAKICPAYIEVIVRRKDVASPIIIREYLDECYRNTGPWMSHTKRMLRHKALIQAARVAFGFSGIYDEDEAMRITEAEVVSSQPKTAKKEIKMPTIKREAEECRN